MVYKNERVDTGACEKWVPGQNRSLRLPTSRHRTNCTSVSHFWSSSQCQLSCTAVHEKFSSCCRLSKASLIGGEALATVNLCIVLLFFIPGVDLEILFQQVLLASDAKHLRRVVFENEL